MRPETRQRQLRRTLGAAAIATTEVGYALDISPDQVDVVHFEQLVAQGRRLAEAGQAADASAALGEALSLRRGEPLAASHLLSITGLTFVIPPV